MYIATSNNIAVQSAAHSKTQKLLRQEKEKHKVI